jgi:DNA polymerase-3 subunit gamma/tau
VVEGGHDPRRFVTDLLERLRDLVILATVPEAGEKGLIDAPADRVEVMQAQAERFGAAELSRAADIVNTGLTEMRGNAAPRLQLELICARVMLPGAYQDELSLMARVDKLERRATLVGGQEGAAMVAPPVAQVPVAQMPPVQMPSVQMAAPVAPVAPPAPVQQPQPQPTQAQPPAPQQAAPGAWPIPRSFPASGAPAPAPVAAPAPTPAPAQQPVQQQAAPQPPAQQPQPHPHPQPTAPGPQGQQGAAQVRQLWPQVLEAVKNRRRFTWILLSQNGQVAGFDGSTLQVSFINAGARDSFVSSNSDDVLRQALADALGVDWRVECIVDPSGGAGSAPAPQAAPSGGGGWGAPQQAATATAVGGHQTGQGGFRAPSAPPAPAAPPAAVGRPQPPEQPAPQAPAQGHPPHSQVQAPPAAPAPRPGSATAPQPPAPVDEYDDYPPEDYPVDDHPDAVVPGPPSQGPSGEELIMRELNATVLEEIQHGN